MKIKAFIFDLDGVITDTAAYHYEAWKNLCREYGLRFDRQMNEQLKGVSRQKSMEIILKENGKCCDYTEDEIQRMIQKKNDCYVEALHQLTPADILPGINQFIADTRAAGIKTAVASASKNAGYVLEQLEMKRCFDYIADASKIKHSKPHPEVFLNCAEYLHMDPAECIGIEDAQAGIEAIKAAGMTAVGIGVTVTSIAPDISYRCTEELTYSSLAALL